MVTVLKDGPYLRVLEAKIKSEIIFNGQKERQKNTIRYADVVLPIISLFVMACIEQLISRMTNPDIYKFM